MHSTPVPFASRHRRNASFVGSDNGRGYCARCTLFNVIRILKENRGLFRAGLFSISHSLEKPTNTPTLDIVNCVYRNVFPSIANWYIMDVSDVIAIKRPNHK